MEIPLFSCYIVFGNKLLQESSIGVLMFSCQNKGVFMFISDYIGESNEYDKKLMLEEKKPKSWLKSVSVFANGKGGILFFGVADDDMLVGLADSRRISEKISEIIKTRMDPIPQTDLELREENGKQFIILRVLSGVEHHTIM